MKEQLDLWDKVVCFISLDGIVEEVLGSQCFSHICKDDNPRKRTMPWTGGNKRAKKHSSLSQSVKGQLLAVPMPSKPPENVRCGQEALLDISISSITRQYVENQLHYREQALCIIVQLLSTFVLFQSMLQLAHVANSSRPRSKNVYVEMAFQWLLEWKCKINFSQYSIVQKSCHDCLSIYCSSGKWETMYCEYWLFVLIHTCSILH